MLRNCLQRSLFLLGSHSRGNNGFKGFFTKYLDRFYTVYVTGYLRNVHMNKGSWIWHEASDVVNR